MNRINEIVLFTIILLFISCGTNENHAQIENVVEGEEFEHDGKNYKFQNDHNDERDMYKLGIEAVKNNDTILYNKVMKQYLLSPFPNKGISIAELMLVKNGYSKAYFDKVELYTYKSEKYYSKESERMIIDYLKKAKAGGYNVGNIEVFGKTINSDSIRLE